MISWFELYSYAISSCECKKVVSDILSVIMLSICIENID